MKLEYINEQRLSEMYDDMLNDCHDTINICGMAYCPSTVLYRVDPIAYSCGSDDYASSLAGDGYVIENYNDQDESLHRCQHCKDWFDDKDEARECCDHLNEGK